MEDLTKKAKYCIIKINRGCLPLQKFAFYRSTKAESGKRKRKNAGGNRVKKTLVKIFLFVHILFE